MPCCDCSTTEGESELSTGYGTELHFPSLIGDPNILLLYTGAMRDLTEEQHSVERNSTQPTVQS